MLKYLEVKGHDMCNLLSNGSEKKKKAYPEHKYT